MKETDSILRIVEPDLTRILRQSCEMESIFSKNAFALAKLSIDFTSGPWMKELALASRAISAFQASPEFRAIQIDSARISEMTASIGLRFAEALAPFRTTVAEIAMNFASQLDANRQALSAIRLEDKKWLRDFESVTGKIAEMAQINFAIPETALLHWSDKLLASRARLLEDCVLNTGVLEKFHASAILPDAKVSLDQLEVASQFVFDHAEVVRHLPPRLPVPEGDRPDDGKPHRDEEIGAKLEFALGRLDERLVELRRQAWRNLAGGIAGARLGMTGIRELFTDTLHTLAPDAEVKATVIWQARPKNITQPTRRMRLEFVLGEKKAGEADSLLQFDESVKRTQKFVHAFADDVELVRAQMAHLEIWIYLLLLHSQERSRSN
jgi:hypothetical protein